MTDLLVEQDPPLAWVRINRPAKRNAISSAMWLELPHLAQRLARDAALRVVLLSGAGAEAFCAGADIAEMRANLQHPHAMQVMQKATQEGQNAWRRLALPTIAVIRGACTGGGCGLALCCDLRLATPESFFAIPPAKLGLVYSLADTKRLVDIVGPARAKEMLFTGRNLDASEALEIGLINRIVAADRLEATARELALNIAESAQSSVRAAKRIVDAISAGAAAETPESIKLFSDSFSSADFHEGAAAFLQKRKPKF
jgi:enoyl-CoA hydratase/carnithine racemase